MSGGNKADYCPPERGLVLGQKGVQEVSRSADEWMADWLCGWRLGRWLEERLGCLPTEEACQGTGAGLGNVRHDMETKLTTVPHGEALSWATGHKESAVMNGEMNEWMTGLLTG